MRTTTVRERPIIFSGDMVRAVLAGRKTRTMRIIKPQPVGSMGCDYDLADAERGSLDHVWWDDTRKYRQPGQVGDRLWVRETFFYEWPDEQPPDDMRKCRIVYRADDESYPAYSERHGYRWSPSIHMPRWASRITLEITDVAAQRVQEISEADVLAEGLTQGDGVWEGSLRRAFVQLWNKINGPDAWDRNDWCWAVAFKTVEVHNAGWIRQ